MKNRRFPYGYEMQTGLIVICLKEADTVKQIFSQYLNGKNLKNIAEVNKKNKLTPTEKQRWDVDVTSS